MIVSNKQMTRFISFLLLMTSLITTGVSNAQEERWFRIELLIFSRESAPAYGNETWDPTPNLSYPSLGRFLIDPGVMDENMALYDATGVVDELGRQTLTVNQHLPEELETVADPNEELLGELLADVQVVDQADIIDLPATDLRNEEMKEDADMPLLRTPSPFIVLAPSELEFRNKAAAMERSGRFRTLFHHTWLQAIAGQDDTIPIILDQSGDNADWPQLQGSVRFYLSRYLHLETNLWLNTHGPYLPPQWQMPPPPLGPQSLTIIYPPDPNSVAQDPNHPVLDPNSVAGYAMMPVIEDEAVIEEALESDELESVELEMPGPIYPWRHAISLQQKRRMRSTEVHYIDHPLLGVVVKITPLTEEELHARALAEDAVTQVDPEALIN